jgi:tRNA G10  N-methylase Trm11
MKEFSPKSLCILGRQPVLGLAELERLFGARHLQPLKGAALLDLDIDEIDFSRLGGTLKLAKVLTILPTTVWTELVDYLKHSVPQHLQYLPEGSLTLGLSVYGLPVPINKINRDALSLKKIIKQSGRGARVVPNKAQQLNSAQVLHNKLTSRGAWELLLVADGQRTILAQTMFVQDIEAYAARDQVRPARDARVGMLPPKLAQMMINLAKPRSGGTLLDPFCGSGVILQEGLLMGYHVIGGDIDKRMVEYSKTNLNWLRQGHEFNDDMFQVIVADAKSHEWLGKIDAVVSETYLGKPLKTLPPRPQLNFIANEVNNILKQFLLNMALQLPIGTALCLGVPAWRKPGGGLIRLPLLDQLTDMGYTYLDLEHAEHEELVYYRDDQIVARQLLLLKRS